MLISRDQHGQIVGGNLGCVLQGMRKLAGQSGIVLGNLAGFNPGMFGKLLLLKAP